MSSQVPAFVDSHVHLWDLDKLRYPWLDLPEFDALRRNYLPADWRVDSHAFDVAGLVHVQAEMDHNLDPVDETQWLASLDFGEDPPPIVYVAYADLRDPRLAETLERHLAAGPVRGIRQEAWFDPASRRADIPRHNLLDDRHWRVGLELLPSYDLSFDLLVWPHQLPQAGEIFAGIPELRVVLEHVGLPPIGDASAMGRWREGLEGFAEQVPGSVLKLSAMAFVAGGWRTDDIGPIVLAAIDIFGVDRCILGSNYPVDRVGASYEQIWQGYEQITRDFEPGHRDLLFRANAVNVYRIV